MQFKAVTNMCPMDGVSKRTDIDNLVNKLAKEYPDIRKKVFSAIEKADFNDWEK